MFPSCSRSPTPTRWRSGAGPGPRLAVSGASVSLGAWHPSAPWVPAVEGDFAGGPAGAWFGAHTDIRAPSGLGVDLQASAGLLLTGDLELALGLTPAATAGWRGKRVDATLGLTAPLALRVTGGPALRAPVRVEPWLGVHLGPITLGAGGAAGDKPPWRWISRGWSRSRGIRAGCDVCQDRAGACRAS